ncbi:MAG: hypothetical protein ACJ74G_09650 [Blastocatellia bacterium]
MKRFSKMRIITLTIALLLGAIPVTATERPFALNGNGVAAFLADEAGNITGANVTISGTATHLGLWTATGTVHYALPNENGKIPSSGEAGLISADGDKLNVVVQGLFDPATGTDHGVFRFVGGTGRFATASGSADFVVTVNPLTGGFTLTVVGTIDY